MSVFGVSLLDLFLLFFCLSVPFIVLAGVVTVLYRRDRRRTPPEARYVAGDVYPTYAPRRPAPPRRRARPRIEGADEPGDKVDPGLRPPD